MLNTSAVAQLLAKPPLNNIYVSTGACKQD
jgi:hypothetical protein